MTVDFSFSRKRIFLISFLNVFLFRPHIERNMVKQVKQIFGAGSRVENGEGDKQ